MLSTSPMAALFGRSPFKPLQQHMRVVIECVNEVQPLFEALIAGEQAVLGELKHRIFVKEREADVLRNEMCDQLPRSMLLAVDRRDLLDLLAVQDAMADTAQDIAGLLVERTMDVPAGLADPLLRLVVRCTETCHQAQRIIDELDQLLETGFRGRELARVEEMIVELARMESDTDLMGMALARALFVEEERLKPVSVMFWYQLIHWIGNLADSAEKVGERLRVMIAR